MRPRSIIRHAGQLSMAYGAQPRKRAGGGRGRGHHVWVQLHSNGKDPQAFQNERKEAMRVAGRKFFDEHGVP